MYFSSGYCACSNAAYNFVCPINPDPLPNPGRPASIDYNKNHIIEMGELLRLIQLYNARDFHCARSASTTDDGYELGLLDAHTCAGHDTDYRPRDWRINLSELLRAIQLYTFGGYRFCGYASTEDGFCAKS